MTLLLLCRLILEFPCFLLSESNRLYFTEVLCFHLCFCVPEWRAPFCIRQDRQEGHKVTPLSIHLSFSSTATRPPSFFPHLKHPSPSLSFYSFLCSHGRNAWRVCVCRVTQKKIVEEKGEGIRSFLPIKQSGWPKMWGGREEEKVKKKANGRDRVERTWWTAKKTHILFVLYNIYPPTFSDPPRKTHTHAQAHMDYLTSTNTWAQTKMSEPNTTIASFVLVNIEIGGYKCTKKSGESVIIAFAIKKSVERERDDRNECARLPLSFYT